MNDHFPTSMVHKATTVFKEHHIMIHYRSTNDLDPKRLTADLEKVPWLILDMFDDPDEALDMWMFLYQNAKRDLYITLIDTCKTDCREFFQYVEELDPKSHAPPPPKLQVDNDTILTNTFDITLSLNEFLENCTHVKPPLLNWHHNLQVI